MLSLCPRPDGLPRSLPDLTPYRLCPWFGLARGAVAYRVQLRRLGGAGEARACVSYAWFDWFETKKRVPTCGLCTLVSGSISIRVVVRVWALCCCLAQASLNACSLRMYLSLAACISLLICSVGPGSPMPSAFCNATSARPYWRRIGTNTPWKMPVKVSERRGWNTW